MLTGGGTVRVGPATVVKARDPLRSSSNSLTGRLTPFTHANILDNSAGYLRRGLGQAMTGKTVTRADLCEAVYQKVGLSRTESAALVELVLKEITD